MPFLMRKQLAKQKNFLEEPLELMTKQVIHPIIILTYKPQLLGAGYLAGKESELGKLGIQTEVIEWKSPNPGSLFYKGLETGNPCDVKFIVNADDFPVDDNGVLETFSFMKDRLQGYPLAVGQRRRIRLSYFDNLNARRQLHEMFMATLYPDVDT